LPEGFAGDSPLLLETVGGMIGPSAELCVTLQKKYGFRLAEQQGSARTQAHCETVDSSVGVLLPSLGGHTAPTL